jgi:4-alpha-glucanotransferase
VTLNKHDTLNQHEKSALQSNQLDSLLHSYGIASEYIEFSGQHAHIKSEHRLHMLQCMGVNVATAADVDAHYQQQLIRRWGRLLPPVLLRGEAAAALPACVPSAALQQELHWQLQLEDGTTTAGTCIPEQLAQLATHELASGTVVEVAVPLPALPLGYHQLKLTLGEQQVESLLVVAPAQAWQPPGLAENRRFWGLSCQLYTLRSADNWGIGDFADLLHLVELAGQQGASFILLNPLHYLDLRYPDNASPYSPSDRRFLNPLYIAPELCAEFMAAAPQAWFMREHTQATLEAVRNNDLVEYRQLAAVKLPLLAMMFEYFQQHDLSNDSERAVDFYRFCVRSGDPLRQFAELQSQLKIREEAQFSDPLFHCYLQWVAQVQLDACQQLAHKVGMRIGLVRDLAVGSSSDGTEVLSNPALFCQQARIGAPPDNINPHGQNWGLPPLLPAALLENRCAHFVALLRSNMQHCGALRIDHVMALLRLWWCPNDGSNGNGAYVHYPVDALFAILRLESCRAQCVVIGEDLGVVPPEIRGYLDDGGLYSNCVFYFEKYDGWHFRKPEHYKEQALMMLANHDVAPLRAWWELRDIPLRRQLGLILTDDNVQQESTNRQGEKGMMLQWLAEQNLLPASWQERDLSRPIDAALVGALLTASGRTASRFLSVQLDDLCGLATPVNVPGTSTEYPNWRRKLPQSLSTLFAAPHVQAWLALLREARPA